ncbi:MAG: ABC transporter permease, partial [Oscillospiraceae bacterium]
IFTIMYLVPGDPAINALGAEASEEALQQFRELHGLDKSYFEQLTTFLSDVFLHFDFGTSYFYGLPVLSEFVTRLPRTFMLSIICILVDAVLGIPMGILAAKHRNSPLDEGLMLFSIAGISIPGFWLGLLLVMLLSRELGWLPAFGIGTWKHWVMPVIAGSLGGLAQNVRLTRSAVLETLRADFVTTARAKGVKERSVTYKHMLPNAMIPVINSLGGRLAGAISGTVIIETVFAFPGIGLYLTNAINQRDYPVVRACVLVMALFSSVVMLFVDLVYAAIDPRIKAQYTKQGASFLRFKRKEKEVQA